MLSGLAQTTYNFCRRSSTPAEGVGLAVALGSNLGDRLENLQAARRQIIELDEVTPPILSSGIYETEPVDCERDASKFLNAVVEFDYDGDPGQLLGQVARIEESLGRKGDHQKNVSRPE